jgi:hypothetical protein
LHIPFYQISLLRKLQSCRYCAADAEMLGVMASGAEGFEVGRVQGYGWVCYIRSCQMYPVV